MSNIDDLVLGQMLVDRKIVTAEQLLQLSESHPTKPLSQVIVESGKLTAAQLEALAAEQTVKTVNAKPPLPVEKTKVRSVPANDGLPADVREMISQPDFCFDKFVLIGLLGKGGMGEVWKAWQRDLRRYVAIKFVDLRQEEELERFFREARMAASLNHPNITGTYELNKYEDRHYIVMEFVDGVTLQGLAGKVPFKKAVKIVREAAQGLDYAHKQGIIHRDIKPQNIMLAKNGRVYIMDFGLAKQQKDAQGNTVQGQILGTPAYMSPEQAEGKIARLDRRTDVYSLGATLYTLAVGKPPISGRAVVDILYKVVHGEIPPPSKVNPKVPLDIEAIILKAMDRNAAARYPSAAAFAEDLRRYMDGEPISATPPSAISNLKRMVRRQRVPVILSAVVVLAVIISFFALRHASTATEKGGEAEEALKKKEEELKRKERELEEKGKAEKLRASIDKVRDAFLEAEKLLTVDGEDWRRIMKQADVAIAAGAAVAKDNPGFAEPCHYKARAQALKLDWVQAEREYLEAIRVDPKHAPSRLHLSWLYQYWGEDQDISRDFTGRSVSKDGEATRAKARPHLEAFLQLSPDKDERILAEGALLYLDGRFRQAEDRLKEIRKEAAESWELHYFIARAMRRVGRWREMYEQLGYLSRIAKNHPVANSFGAACYSEFAEIAVVNPGDVERRLGAALSFCERNIAEQGGNPVAWCQRAWVHLLQKKEAEAISDADTAMKIDPRRTASLLMKAYAAQLKGTPDGNRGYAAEALKIDPTLGRAEIITGDHWLTQQDAGEALRCYERAIRLEPALGEGHFSAFQAEMLLKHPDEALRHLGDAARSDPLHYCHQYLGQLWGFIQQPLPKDVKERFLSDLLNAGQQLSDRLPYMAEPHWIFAEALLYAGNADKALEEINIADKILGSASRFLFCRGRVLMKLKRWKEAEGDVRTTTSFNRDDGDAWKHLGIILMELNRPKEAVAAFEESIKQWGPKIEGWTQHLQPMLAEARRKADF